jgi:hypothetical protein
MLPYKKSDTRESSSDSFNNTTMTPFYNFYISQPARRLAGDPIRQILVDFPFLIGVNAGLCGYDCKTKVVMGEKRFSASCAVEFS